MGEGVPAVEVADHRGLAWDRVLGRTKLTLMALRPLTGACLITTGSFSTCRDRQSNPRTITVGLEQAEVGCRPDDRRRRWPGRIAVVTRDDRRERTRQRLAMLRPALVKHIGRCATEMASFGVNGA